METLKAISSRKSVRKYRQEQVDDEKLDAIIAAGISAPVASGKYDSLHITVVQDKALLGRINDAVSAFLFKLMGTKIDMDFGAPAIVFVSSTPAMHPGLEYANVACVLENMTIAATSLDVDSIIWGSAPEAVAQSKELCAALGIPKGFKPLLCISLGYAAAPEEPKKHSIAMNRI